MNIITLFLNRSFFILGHMYGNGHGTCRDGKMVQNWHDGTTSRRYTVIASIFFTDFSAVVSDFLDRFASNLVVARI